MIEIAKNYYFVFGGLTIVGGIMGFVKKGSIVSVIAGGLAGVLLLVAALWLKEKPQNGLILGGAVSFLLVGWSLYNFFPKYKMMPHGMVLALALFSVIVTALAFAKK